MIRGSIPRESKQGGSMSPSPFASDDAPEMGTDDLAAGVAAPPTDPPGGEGGAGQDSVPAGDTASGDVPAPDDPETSGEAEPVLGPDAPVVTLEHDVWVDSFIAYPIAPRVEYEVAVARETMDGYCKSGRFRCNPGDYLVRVPGDGPNDFLVVAAEEFDAAFERA